eukprot:12381645-Prorocentrum_lima.AAC.1
MTSSLVGSEMCIRDRAWTKPIRTDGFFSAMQTMAAESQMTQEESSTKPVSYTHLTLPTICSV